MPGNNQPMKNCGDLHYQYPELTLPNCSVDDHAGPGLKMVEYKGKTFQLCKPVLNFLRWEGINESPAPPVPRNNQPCDRIYEDGAYTVKFINGVACCPSCGLPVKEHNHDK